MRRRRKRDDLQERLTSVGYLIGPSSCSRVFGKDLQHLIYAYLRSSWEFSWSDNPAVH